MATIFGNVGRILTGAKRTQVQIALASGPVVVGNTFLYDEPVSIPTDSAGNFSVTLAMGDYWFTVSTKRVLVSVDDTTNTYPLSERIISAVVQAPTAPAGGGNPVASQTVFGLVKADANVGNFVAVSGFFVAADYTALRGLANLPNNKWCYVAGTDENWRWDGASVAAESSSVLKPDDTVIGNPGRWLLSNANGGTLREETTVAAMLAKPSNAGIRLVCVTERESLDYATFYKFKFGDLTAANGSTILAPADNGGRYFALSI